MLILELNIHLGFEDNSEIFFLFLNENLCSDPSLEPSHETVLMRDLNTFYILVCYYYLEKGKIALIYPW